MMRFRFWRALDAPLVLLSALFFVAGLTFMYSSSLANASLAIFWKQALFFGVGAVLLFFLASYTYQTLAKVNRVTYLVLIGLLVFVLLFGRTIRGSTRWIDIGFFQLQPAEFAKLIVVIALSRWMYLYRGQINTWKNVFLTLLLAGIPAALVLVEPDLGSSAVIMSVWFVMLLASPISKWRVAVLACLGLLAAVLVWQFVLLDFQRARVETFLNPNLDPRGLGYNVRQAIISVGSGQAWGRGVGRGVQGQLKFLPERQTDFIFATIGEEVGFVGAASIVVLYGLLLWRLLVISRRARDDLGRYVTVGICGLFGIQAGVNIAMNLGLFPVTGIPLPFLSYGGSSLLVSFMALGVAHNVARQSAPLRF